MLAQKRRPCSRPKKSKDREILRQRTRDVLSQELSFISNPAFLAMDDANFWRKVLSRPNRDSTSGTRTAPKPSSNPNFEHLCNAALLTVAEERELFRSMNYMKFRANRIRSTLNAVRPSGRKLQQVDECIRRATELRNEIVVANTRLVVSIAKKFASEKMAFEDLLSAGLESLLNATEKFDYARGFRFSTYTTMVVRRTLYRQMERSQRTNTRFISGQAEVLDAEANDPLDMGPSEVKLARRGEQLAQLLSKLDDRERLIVEARCGFVDLGMKATLSNLGNKLGVCKERVRQLETRAMRKIRDAIAELGLVTELREFVVE